MNDLKESLKATSAKYKSDYGCCDRKPDDIVNHPQHHISKGGIETIDVIEAWTEGLDGIVAVDTANVIKYISRWNKKNGIEDLKKARWYLNHLITEMERRMKEDCCIE